MNISYNWLRELIDTGLSPEDTAKALTRVGLAVEGIHPYKDDHILDIDLTSNRPDCLSHFGIARELSVISGRPVSISELGSKHGSAENDGLVTLNAPDLCLRFTARVIRGVRVGPSPQWLVDRLESLGERSINNIADITNYVMLELGQPMHAFDLDKLTEKRIVVRRAKRGEKIVTLDEAERELADNMLAICDAEKPIAVAGVMGGLDSGITDATENVLLEVAYFKRESIRDTSRKLNLASEASYRFERGVDINNLLRASNRATELILQLAGGNPEPIVDVYPEPVQPVSVRSSSVSVAVTRLTGLSVEDRECDRILTAIGLVRTSDDEYIAPSWRHDIAIEEDLIEEVARHAGYENIREELPPAFGAGEYQPHEAVEKSIRSLLCAASFNEAISYSFINTAWDQRVESLISAETGPLPNPVTLRDSVIEGAVRMRTSCIPGLLEAAKHNMNHQRRDLKLFEIGKVFHASKDAGALPNESKCLSLLATGEHRLEIGGKSARSVDFYDLKGVVESIIRTAGHAEAEFSPFEAVQFRKGQAAIFRLGDRIVGFIGRLSDALSREMKFRKPVYLAEIDLDRLLGIPYEPPIYRPLSNMPLSERDRTFLISKELQYGDLISCLNQSRTSHCVNISFYDLYESDNSEERSITLRFSFGSSTSTLTDEQVEEEMNSLSDSVKAEFGEKVRLQ